MGTLNIIMCVKVSEQPDPPKDQEGCREGGCSWCDVPVWISKRMREIIVSTDNQILICCPPCKEEFASACAEPVDIVDVGGQTRNGK